LAEEHYYFVYVGGKIKRITPTITSILNKGIQHSILSNFFEINVEFETKLPVHVGTGEIDCSFEEKRNQCYCVRKHVKKNGYLIIPGSTVKGVLSTYFLALFKDNYEVSFLFGAPGYQSRVIVEDFISESKPVIEESPKQWKPHRYKPGSIKLYKPVDKYHDHEKILCLECIPKDATIKGKIIVLNSNEEEVAKIILALGYMPKEEKEHSYQMGYLMIGYGKGKGFGKIMLKKESLSIVKYDSQDYFSSGVNVTNGVMEKAVLLFDKVLRNVWNDVFRER